METKRRGTIRTNDPEGMRARILDAAADLFQARGYHDTSVQDVKRRAGVSSGARRAYGARLARTNCR